jgi:hypothetical protein
MPSQPVPGNLLSARESALLAFEPHEWELLTKLPARVVIAATSAELDSDKRTVREGLAGINAIAAGGSSGSDLVRAIVSAIYAEAEPDPPTAEQFRNRETGITEVLVSCRAAALVLGERASQRDAQAYRQWLESIAEIVCGAAKSGGVLGVGGSMLSANEQKFLVDLAEALRNA